VLIQRVPNDASPMGSRNGYDWTAM
jgi:hypothetical protein